MKRKHQHPQYAPLFDTPPEPPKSPNVATVATTISPREEQQRWDAYVGHKHRPTLPRLPDYVPEKKKPTMPAPYRRNPTPTP